MLCAHPHCCRTRVGRRASTYSHLGRLLGEPPPLEAVASSGWGGGSLGGPRSGAPSREQARLPTWWFPGPGSPPPAAGEMPAFPEVRGAERLLPRRPPRKGANSPCAPNSAEPSESTTLGTQSALRTCIYIRPRIYISPQGRAGRGVEAWGEDRARGSSVPPVRPRYKLVLAARVCPCFCGTKVVNTGPGWGEVSQSAEGGKAATGSAGAAASSRGPSGEVAAGRGVDEAVRGAAQVSVRPGGGHRAVGRSPGHSHVLGLRCNLGKRLLPWPPA